jgi:hypothetical protein
MTPQDINPLYAAIEGATEMGEYIDAHSAQEIINDVKSFAIEHRYKGHDELRTRIAIAAMQGMVVNGAQTKDSGKSLHPVELAQLAVNQACALIKELQKPITDENK